MVDCFVAVKTPKRHAELMADLLVSADHRGHFSHGMNRLEMYLNDILAGAMDASAEPTILKVCIIYIDSDRERACARECMHRWKSILIFFCVNRSTH